MMVKASKANFNSTKNNDFCGSGADSIKKFTPSLGIPYLGV
jgi:hypothetical protein